MDFFTSLVRYEIDLWNAIEDALRSQGQIGLARLQAVSVLAEHAGAGRVHDISGEIGITVGAASKLVDRLERDGLAVRSPNPDDRRSSLIALTADGTRALHAAADVRDTVLGAVIDPDAERSALSAIAALQSRLDEYKKAGAA
ncbi:MarR family winged helix-turn-helix transcriptional regulator [Micromonospora sp. DT81.3]|uniref:MarR family winged helix-turn-helix transcriptional regulator n=1 Tax=Micromonospora sp. DT81.3 TaxID=3416523 RepID=UPI003CF6F626